MNADSKARKAESLGTKALSSFRSIVSKLEAANVLHLQAHDAHIAAADDHHTLAAQHSQSALDQGTALSDNKRVIEKLTAIVG